MTYLELQNQVLEACGHSSATSSIPRTRVKRELNAWHRRILTDPRFNALLRDSVYTFDTVANITTYGLQVGRINGISNDTYEQTLSLRDRAWLRRFDPGETAIGDPATAYIILGWFPVQKHPADASSIFAKSTSAGDTTQVFDWEFLLSTGDRVSGNTTLTGTTAVQLGTATTVVQVVKLSLRTAGAGTITVLEDSGTGTVLVTYLAGALNKQFQHVQLHPTPGSVATYRVDHVRVLVDLVQDTDIPLLPYDFHHLIGMGAEYDEWRKLSDDRAPMVYQDLTNELNKLGAYVWDLLDDTQGSNPDRSRLGSWFRSGT